MYLLIVYNDFENDKICGYFKFRFVKQVINWSKGIITYSDCTNKITKSRTYKRLFKVIKLKN